jgi:hypothetical protein
MNQEFFVDPFHDSFIEGYQPSSTCHYLSHDYSFPKAERNLQVGSSTTSNDEAGPASYSDTLEMTQKRFWLKPSGTFSKAAKETFVSASLKKTHSLPGPGHYKTEEKNESFKGPKAVFGKDSRPGLFDNIEALSQGIPDSFKYRPFAEVKRIKNGLYHKPYFKPAFDKSLIKSVGPGSYNPDFSLDKRVLKRAIIFKLSKADRLIKKTVSLKKMSLNASQVPPVGTYELLNDSLTMFGSQKKRISGISPYVVPRFTEKEIKLRQGIPGPGTYNIGPLPKINKNQEKEVNYETRKKKRYVKAI